MTIEILRAALGWCALINIGMLIFWFAFVSVAGNWMHQFHGKMFKISREEFDAIHYRLMGQFKLGIFLLNLVPYLALRIVG